MCNIIKKLIIDIANRTKVQNTLKFIPNIINKILRKSDRITKKHN